MATVIPQNLTIRKEIFSLITWCFICLDKRCLHKVIIIDGSATLVQALQGTGLIDEYRFLVEPFIMGRGRRFFGEGTTMHKLRLVESKTLKGGTLALIYQPVAS